jgi:sugar/nucleoside kinase (ribokinase family)
VSGQADRADRLAPTVPTDLIVATPAFLDMTFVGLDALPQLGEERFAGDLVRSPGGGAITAVAAARLGLDTALVAPLGDDMPGEYVRSELEQEGVNVSGPRIAKTAQTLVMPCGEDRAMVTVDPGPRARAADIAEFLPAAGFAANLEQLHLAPEDARVYLTCGDDDAHAFAGRIPEATQRASVLVLDRADALVVTRTETLDDALAVLGNCVETAIVALGPRGTVAMTGGERVDAPSFGTGPAVDTTGDRDLLAAAYAWAHLSGAEPRACIAWAQLYAELAMSVPTATGGAVDEARLLEEGIKRELVPPPQAPRR